MDKKIFNVGLIGAGPGIGIYHAKAVHDTEGAKLLWVCDTNPDAVSKMVSEYDVPKSTADYHDVLADPDVDAVIIAVPDQLHRQVIVDTLAAKKHILCEKPLALVKEDIDGDHRRGKEKRQGVHGRTDLPLYSRLHRGKEAHRCRRNRRADLHRVGICS